MRRIAWTGVQGTEAIGPPRLLRARRERPHRCRAGEKGDEIAPPHLRPQTHDETSYLANPPPGRGSTATSNRVDESPRCQRAIVLNMLFIAYHNNRGTPPWPRRVAI